jgi:hypothetical protein
MKRVWIATAVTAISVIGISPGAWGQVPLPSDRESWHFEITPLVWFSGLDGVVKARGRTVRLEDVDDLSGGVQWGTRFEVSRSWLVLWWEGSNMKLNTDGTTDDGDPATVELRQRIGELAGAYRAFGPSWLVDLVLGARFTDLKSTTQVQGEAEVEGTRNCVDTFAGIRFNWDLARKIPVLLAGDVGSGGSTVTWKVTANAGYRISDHIAISVGWRQLETDYNEGSGEEQFIYDIKQRGLLVGLTIGF